MSGSYRDYVIKDGRLVGRFEEMYAECKEIPWHQDETAVAVFTDIDLVILRHMKDRFGFKKIADVGCGLGYVTSRIHREVLDEKDHIMGFDLSPAAISKARDMFQEIEFDVLNITEPLPVRFYNMFDLVICKECHWYILNHLRIFKENILKMSNEWLYLVQSFPETRPYLGMDVFPSPESIIDFWAEAGTPEYRLIEWDSTYGGRPMVHLYLRKSK